MMQGMVIMVIATILSSITFSYLFYMLGHSENNIFEPIQKDLCKLNDINRNFLNFIGYLFIMLLTAFLKVSFGINFLLSGMIFGFLGALIDAFFMNNLIENIISEHREQF